MEQEIGPGVGAGDGAGGADDGANKTIGADVVIGSVVQCCILDDQATNTVFDLNALVVSGDAIAFNATEKGAADAGSVASIGVVRAGVVENVTGRAADDT